MNCSMDQAQENMRDVPKIFDGGDIDSSGHWEGALMCCLSCRETEPMRYTITGTYMLFALECGECGQRFCEV